MTKKRESDILASTYFDSMDVVRSVDITSERHHLIDMRDKVIARDVPCELDKESEAFLNNSDVVGVVASYTIFCRPNVDVKEGDKLIVNHLDRIYDCVAGVPFNFRSHLEIPVSLKERV